MKLINGLTFGAGTGLITSGLLGYANEYAVVTILIGTVFVLSEAGRFILKY